MVGMAKDMQITKAAIIIILAIGLCIFIIFIFLHFIKNVMLIIAQHIQHCKTLFISKEKLSLEQNHAGNGKLM